MNRTIENRREFLRRATLSAVALPFLLNCKSEIAAQKSESDILRLIKQNAISPANEWSGAIDAPNDVTWRTVLSNDPDTGEKIIISGTVFEPDGKRAAPNVLIYLYHTDREGFYGRGGEPKHGRYRGWMLTDKDGRYEFQTIKPAPYPNRNIAAHIHMTLTTTTSKEDWIDSILFEGDKLISAKERETAGQKGGFNPILKLEKKADLSWQATRDIRLWRA